MREMDLLDAVQPKNNLKRTQIIVTQASQKKRPEDEMIMLMKSVNNRVKKSIVSGQIEIVSEREWTLR